MVVGASGDEPKPGIAQDRRHRLGILDHLAGVVPVRGLQRLCKTDGFRRDRVHQGTALHPGEDRLVDRLCMLLAAEDEPAARTTQGLVGGRCDEVDDARRVRVDARGAKPGDVRDVRHAVGIDPVGDLLECLEVDLTRVGRSPADDHCRLHLLRLLLDHTIVEGLSGEVDAVLVDLVHLAAERDRGTVREVPALGERHRHHPVDAALHDREVNSHVGLGARVGLHVRVLGAEELFDAVAGEVLRLVVELAPTVVTLPGIALGVLVGHDRAHGLEHGTAHEVLGGDKLEPVHLAEPLALDDPRNFWIHIGKMRHINRIGLRHV
ncbi:hypothetical protein DSECCO2_409870 [anaerobic digester metagenome]